MNNGLGMLPEIRTGVDTGQTAEDRDSKCSNCRDVLGSLTGMLEGSSGFLPPPILVPFPGAIPEERN